LIKNKSKRVPYPEANQDRVVIKENIVDNQDTVEIQENQNTVENQKNLDIQENLENKSI
jgi:hypothetical protein